MGTEGYACYCVAEIYDAAVWGSAEDFPGEYYAVGAVYSDDVGHVHSVGWLGGGWFCVAAPGGHEDVGADVG